MVISLRPPLTIVLAITMMSTAAQAAAPTEWACPASIPTVDQHLAQAPLGWEVFQDKAQHILMGVEVTLGHPREQSGTIYDLATRIKGGKGAQVLRWQVDKLHDPHLVCHYFDTTIALTRSVSGYKTCEVVEKAVGAQMRPAVARCF